MIVRTYDKIVEQSRFSRIVREKGKRKKTIARAHNRTEVAAAA